MTAIDAPTRDVAEAFVEWLVEQASTPLLRTMAEFAAEEIILPSGPDEGFAFDPSRQPFNKLWFDEIDSGRWKTFVAVGPTQTGKTLIAFVIPILYHLFEIGESVVVGVPDMNMSADKWREDILPVLEKTKYKEFMPKMGAGSKGGKINAIKFKNGATLKFMSAGGGDKSRAAFSARVLIVTEADGFDESGTTSREANKIEQMKGRLRSHGRNRLVYIECTASISKGCIWVNYTKGSKALIMIRCPHCKAHVHPDREHLVGWQDAETEGEALRSTCFVCPDCGEVWSEEDRLAANQDAILLHRGQKLSAKGKVVGDLPDTETLGFRWSAPNNMFLLAGEIGVDEWNAARAEDEDDAQKKMHQFVWAIPWDPDDLIIIELEAEEVKRRLGPNRKGVVPDGTLWLTTGFDFGQVAGSWWITMAWLGAGTRHIVDYGNLPVGKEEVEENGKPAVLGKLLLDFENIVLSGWHTPTGQVVLPSQVWMDSKWEGDLIRAFCKKAGKRFRPILGLGASQHQGRTYRKPTKITKDVKFLGEQYHAVYRHGIWNFELDADHWKTKLREGLVASLDAPGSISLYESSDKKEHDEITRHFMAEEPMEMARPGKSPLLVWKRLRKGNHLLDCGYINLACGHYVAAEKKKAAKKKQQKPAVGGVKMPDGREFLTLNT